MFLLRTDQVRVKWRTGGECSEVQNAAKPEVAVYTYKVNKVDNVQCVCTHVLINGN